MRKRFSSFVEVMYRKEKENMKLFSKIATALVGMAMAVGVGVAVNSSKVGEVRAAEGDTLLTFSSASVVGGTATSYTSYSDSDWNLNIGGNKVSAGWNKTAANAKQVGETFAIDSTSVTATTYGWVASTKAAVNKAGKLVFSYTGGSGNGSGKLWLGYSSDGTSYSKVTLTAGTQGMSCGSTGTNYTFEFDTIDSAYYAIIVTGGTSGSAFRFDSVTATLYEGASSTDPLESITVSGSMTKTSYYVGESWSSAGLTATGHYESGASKDVTSTATWSFNPTSPALSVTSVVATATIGEVSGSSSAQTVTVSRTNPIQVLYTKSSGESVDVYGYYVGFLDGTGPVIMDGEYGIVAYSKSHDVSGYTEGVTILHVTGSISIFNGLYEINSPSISVASGTYDAPSTPVVYAAAGGETQEYASRLTTVTGTPTVTKGSFDSDPGTADITMSFDLGGGKSVQVFYKKAAQTADSEAFTAIKAAVTDSTEITVKGFTGWYNGFQVQMNGYIKPAEDYTAEDFSQDLLDQTDTVCEDYDDVTNNHDAIEAIWSNLASNDKYPSLPAAQKTILAEAARDESGTVVEQAMARYDYLTGKYNLSNFINGRTPVVFAAPSTISSDNNINSSMSIVVVAVIAITSLSAIGVLLVIKRRKSI